MTSVAQWLAGEPTGYFVVGLVAIGCSRLLRRRQKAQEAPEAKGVQVQVRAQNVVEIDSARRVMRTSQVSRPAISVRRVPALSRC
jgi:hypothetical protein